MRSVMLLKINVIVRLSVKIESFIVEMGSVFNIMLDKNFRLKFVNVWFNIFCYVLKEMVFKIEEVGYKINQLWIYFCKIQRNN